MLISRDDDGKVFGFYERLGLFITIEAAGLSVITCTLILGSAMFKWIRDLFRHGWMKNKPGSACHVSEDVSGSSLFLNLMLSDLLQALGIFPSIRWMHDSKITEGSLCIAQGVLKQVGTNGVALFSLGIACQTFSVLVLRWRIGKCTENLVALGIWAFIALVVGISYKVGIDSDAHIYYGDTGYWCWVDDGHSTERILSQYLWMWSSAGFMVILYGLIFLMLRGIIGSRNGGLSEGNEDRSTNKIAKLMLYYPAIYFICVFPNSVSRWLTFNNYRVTPAFTLFASGLFSLSGFFNVILFLFTRPDLVRRVHDRNSPDAESLIQLNYTGAHQHTADARASNESQAHRLEAVPRSFGSGILPDLTQ